jgi:hypothetical protein
MYLAEAVKPPSYTRPGIDNFNAYPTGGGALNDVRDALNWEWIGEDVSLWGGPYMFWATHTVGSQASLLTNVKYDIYWYSLPVVIDLDTYSSSSVRLPNWNRNVIHTVTIIGWDDSAQTFTYLDTCSRDCNSYSGNHNGGIYTVSYATMFTLMHNLGWGYVY